MKKRTKFWLMIASVLTIAGIIIFGGMMTVLNWDFTKLSTTKYEEKTYNPGDNFQNITIVTDTADIQFLPSENGQCRVVCYDSAKFYHTVSIENNTLNISLKDERKWYDHIGIFNIAEKITVYLPGEQYSSLSVKGSTGNVKLPESFSFDSIAISQSTGNIENYASATGAVIIKTNTGYILTKNVSAESLSLTVTTGKITLSDVKTQGDVHISVSTGKAELSNLSCKNLISTGNTGNLSLKNVIADGAFSLERSTGDISIDQCDAAELTIKTDTGNVTGSLLTEKVFITQTDTGSVKVPKTITGGKCEITTDTGDIKITVIE